MVDLLVKKRLDGSFEPANMDGILGVEHLPCNVILKAKITRPRSKPHHNLFFAVVALAFKNWPESSDFLPDSTEHLRAYLICSAAPEFREALFTIDMRTPNFNEMVTALGIAGAQKRICFPRVDFKRGKMYIVAPKSIAWEKMDQAQINELSNKVSEVLLEETGLSFDDYKRELNKNNIGGCEV